MNLYFTCWQCGKPVLVIEGYTMKRDDRGGIIAVCPWCEASRSAKTWWAAPQRRDHDH